MPLRWCSGSLAVSDLSYLRFHATRIEHLLLLHERPGDDEHLCRKLDAHLHADPLLPFPALGRGVGDVREILIPEK